MKLYSNLLPYLMLISFYSGQIEDFDSKKIMRINQSPYNGVAVQLVGAYDDKLPDRKSLGKFVDRHKQSSKKDIWPWIFLNRIIGNKNESNVRERANKPPFNSIKGIDIENETGALDAFKEIFKQSIELASKLGSPGIVVDPEAYNNLKSYRVRYVSELNFLPKNKVKEKLENFGKDLAIIANDIYPSLKIWFTFTNLEKIYHEGDLKTISYIILGMLDQIKKERYNIQVICGGQTSVRYCSTNVEHLRQKINERALKFKEIQEKYQDIRLGGTIVLWDKPENKKGWLLTKKDCLESDIMFLNDFKPYLQLLFDNYDFVWIYAATAAKYNPYNESVSRIYNPFLSDFFRTSISSPVNLRRFTGR